ncbi:MAG: RNA polymerase-associated protein RapA [Luminiphilus sp.]|jgi:ATP-dependent helicase HepA|nr:RNA polymerase-associated protein RapA [Luminiphilus sp.]
MSEFAIGQRWVSHADVELGLGIVVDLEGRRITLHFPAVGEERTYATDRAPLTRLILESGDRYQHINGQEYAVLERHESEGILAYLIESTNGEQELVSELDIDPHIQLRSPRDRLLNNQLDKLLDFQLRYETLKQRAHFSKSAVRGLLGARTSLLSHQVYIASEVGTRIAPRVLLADEVGLGKTIEAGLILSQQLASGRATRALVLVPDSLIHQWLVEMLRRFSLAFSLFDDERLADLDIETAFESEQLILCPFSLMGRHEDARQSALSAHWDMVIVDEAHHISRQSPEEETLSDFVEALAGHCSGLLLLTATPEQAGIESHFDRLRLLDPDRFSDLPTFLAEQEQFAQWNQVIEQLQTGESTVSLPAGIDQTADSKSQISQLLDRYGTGRVLFRNTRASVPGFPKRNLHAYPLEVPELYQDNRTALFPEMSFPEAQWLEHDPRVGWLETQLRGLRPEKVLVIAASATTALALEQQLHLRAGIRCAAFHEGLTLFERDRAAAYFADEHGGAQALICSEIGSEGRNFQFAHHLICFDLPKNPDLLEQRIGRLDRIGQGSDVVIHVPFIRNTAQEVLFNWHNQALSAFTSSCAVGYTVLQQFQETLDSALANPDAPTEYLLSESLALRTSLEIKMREGRDRLLELNSHNAERGSEIIETIQMEETPEQVLSFAELLFDRIGVSQDYHSETTHLLKPTEMLITGELPGLDEDGTVVSFDRETALARDDVLFLTREHPLLREAMSVVLSSELGNSALGTVKHPKIPGGTVLLECIYSLDCMAPSHLEMGRYVDQTPLRFVIDPKCIDRGQNMGHVAINRMIGPVATATAANVLRRIRPLLEEQLKAADKLAQSELEVRKRTAVNTINEQLGAEQSRLVYLSSVNPGVKDSEIDELNARIAGTLASVNDTQAVSQALRVVVAT